MSIPPLRRSAGTIRALPRASLQGALSLNPNAHEASKVCSPYRRLACVITIGSERCLHCADRFAPSREDWSLKDYEAMRDDVPRTSRWEGPKTPKLQKPKPALVPSIPEPLCSHTKAPLNTCPRKSTLNDAELLQVRKCNQAAPCQSG